MKVVGVTGQMAVGKSTVSAYLEGKGATVLDCDNIARRLADRGSPGWAQVVAAFGDAYMRDDGSLDRAVLGRTVFADRSAMDMLNAILHPLLRCEVRECVRALEAQTEVCIIDAAVLVEARLWELCDQVWLVWASSDCQIARLIQRNGLTAEVARERVRAQTPPSLARSFCTHVVDTTEGYGSTYTQVDILFRDLAVPRTAYHQEGLL